MSEVTESILFRQKLYENFKQSGMLEKLKTSLRMNLLQKIQKPSVTQEQIKFQILQQKKPLYLRDKFLACIVAQYLQKSKKEYSRSILLPEAYLESEESLNFNEIAKITNLGNVIEGNRSFLEVLIEQWMKIRAIGICERSTQTDYSEPVSKKLEEIDKKYRKQIDYWKLIPNSHSSIRDSENKDTNINNLAAKERMQQELEYEKKKITRDLELHIKAQMQKKYEDKYAQRLKEVQKAHQGRLFQLKNRQKIILDSLERKKKDLEAKAKKISDDELKMIKTYEIKLNQLEIEYKLKIKQLENKQKEFWKKQLELRAKKKEYQESIRLVKQKVIEETLNI